MGPAISGQMWCLIGLGVSSVVTHVARCTWWPGKDPEPSSVPPGDSTSPAEPRSVDECDVQGCQSLPCLGLLNQLFCRAGMLVLNRYPQPPKLTVQEYRVRACGSY